MREHRWTEDPAVSREREKARLRRVKEREAATLARLAELEAPLITAATAAKLFRGRARITVGGGSR